MPTNGLLPVSPLGHLLSFFFHFLNIKQKTPNIKVVSERRTIFYRNICSKLLSFKIKFYCCRIHSKEKKNSSEKYILQKYSIYLVSNILKPVLGILECCFQNFFQSVSLAQNNLKSACLQKFGFTYGVFLISILAKKYVPLCLKDGCVKLETQQDYLAK